MTGRSAWRNRSAAVTRKSTRSRHTCRQTQGPRERGPCRLSSRFIEKRAITSSLFPLCDTPIHCPVKRTVFPMCLGLPAMLRCGTVAPTMFYVMRYPPGDRSRCAGERSKTGGNRVNVVTQRSSRWPYRTGADRSSGSYLSARFRPQAFRARSRHMLSSRVQGVARPHGPQAFASPHYASPALDTSPVPPSPASLLPRASVGGATPVHRGGATRPS